MIEQNQIQLFVPALGAVYQRLSTVSTAALRVVTGGIMIPHGYEHFFGRGTLPEWFTGVAPQGMPRFGAGIEPFIGFMASQGYEPAPFWAVLVTAVQFLGGIFLLLGLFTRLSAALIAIFLLVSIFQVAGEFGYWGNRGGWEMPLLWCVASVYFVVHGGGALSIDRMIGKEI